jgi:hypothetical protein
MTPDLTELKRLAEAASKLPWYVAKKTRSSNFVVEADPSLKIVQTFGNSFGAENDAAFIAASNPQAVLSLIARVEKAEAALKPFAQAAKVIDDHSASLQTDVWPDQAACLRAAFDWTVKNIPMSVTVGDLRYARTALEQP